MILTDYFRFPKDLTWEYAVQCGVSHGTIRLPEDGRFSLTDASDWHALCDTFRQNGITPLVVEPLPNCLNDHIKSGDAQRDWAIETFLKMLPIMHNEGIEVVCFNFMAYIGWTRTSRNVPERGGARVTGFSLKDFVPKDDAIGEDALWANYTYFLRAVLPEAEKWGIKLALHPDDPPLPRLGDVSRIFSSYPSILRGMRIIPSGNLGVTFCQATYHLMGADLDKAVEKDLKDKIFFVHFRNCRGTKTDFRETFHDNGDIDMAHMIGLYAANLPAGTPIRVDHVPEMAGESGGTAGYTALGRLYAIGYLKGLLDMWGFLSS